MKNRLLTLFTFIALFMYVSPLTGADVKSIDPNKPTKAQEQQKQAGSASENFDNFKRPSLITQAVALTGLSLLPFIVMILSSFLKIVIVLSLLRNALGVQQAPPQPDYQWHRLHALFVYHVSHRD